MTRLLVTGADGFVGRWLVRAARAAGHHVVAAILPEAAPPPEWQATRALPSVDVARADLKVPADVAALARREPDGVVHLAAVASGAAARERPDEARAINGDATQMLASQLAITSCPRFLFASSGEVYGGRHGGSIAETAARNPGSPYAESKALAESALEAVAADTQLPTVIARAFPHTGPGQGAAYVLPALAARLAEAKRSGATAIRTGNLAAVRDFLDVRDVVRAYLVLLDRGVPGEYYNVASGVGRRLSDCFAALASLVGIEAEARQDAALLRPGDIPVLIGDATKLRLATGWSPEIPFERTLQDLVDAQAH